MLIVTIKLFLLNLSMLANALYQSRIAVSLARVPRTDIWKILGVTCFAIVAASNSAYAQCPKCDFKFVPCNLDNQTSTTRSTLLVDTESNSCKLVDDTGTQLPNAPMTAGSMRFDTSPITTENITAYVRLPDGTESRELKHFLQCQMVYPVPDQYFPGLSVTHPHTLCLRRERVGVYPIGCGLVILQNKVGGSFVALIASISACNAGTIHIGEAYALFQ